MLKLHPNCEYCNKDLPPHATDAMICTYECTFCRDCVETTLENVCPNCGGNFQARPIRPNKKWRPDTGLENHPASDKRINTSFKIEEIKTFSAQIKNIVAQKR